MVKWIHTVEPWQYKSYFPSRVVAIHGVVERERRQCMESTKLKSLTTIGEASSSHTFFLDASSFHLDGAEEQPQRSAVNLQ